VDLSAEKIISRRKFLRGVGALAVVGGAGAAYTRWFEPYALQVHTVRVPVRGDSKTLEAPIRIAHLSDFHASRFVSFEFIDKAVTLALAQRPDLIAVTGDFFTNRLTDPDRYSAILRRLSSAAPTFGCLGNHDGGPWTRRAGGLATPDEALALLRAANIPCLHNRGDAVTIRSRPLQLVGVGDLWSQMCEPEKAFRETPARNGATRVLLNHNPDAKTLLRPFDWDLVLCGHTHGGQLRLPFLGTPFAPVADKRYVEGLHRWENRWLYITRGVGNLHGLRFNCRPQVSVIDLG
jgi:predicted MPP superfamily phosphohydrolase